MKHANRSLQTFVALLLATMLTFCLGIPAFADEVAPEGQLADVAAAPSDDLGEPAQDSSPGALGAQDAPANRPDGEPSAEFDARNPEGADASQGGHSADSPSEARTPDGETSPDEGQVAVPADESEPEIETGTEDDAGSADDPDASVEPAAAPTMMLMSAPLAAPAEPAPARGWSKSGGSWYWYEGNTSEPKLGWHVTDERPGGGTGGLQRYWLGDGGALALSRLITPEEGDGAWWAYARPEGYVVRGKYVARDGKVYLANNDGRLENTGWVVTKAYDGGYQRYWIDEDAHAAIPGYSDDGWYHYTIPNKGYVARGGFTDSAGKRSYANNDGKISKSSGWVVSSAFGHGLQRYWMRAGVMATSELLDASETGWWAYARPEGYVVRGKYVARDGKVYLANNDGRLENPGWLVTKAYDGTYQRYWIDGNARAAIPGYSKDGWAHYTLPNKGYVARGKANIGNNYMVFANNDGKITNNKAGWLVTKKYDSDWQRYWIEDRGGYTAAKLGSFKVAGKQYYGLPDRGYVLRNEMRQIDGNLYSANNDGVLTVDNTYLNFARRYGSSTNYFIVVDNNRHKVAIFTRNGGDWTLSKLWVCSSGQPSKPTVKGYYRVGSRGYSFGDSDHTCYYWTQIHRDWLFHSILYVTGSNRTQIRDGRLGYAISAGCVRLAIENAKWIHDNVPSGTGIYSF